MEKRPVAVDYLIQYILIATLAIIPLAFLLLTQDMFIPIKLTILVATALLVVMFWAIRLAQTGQSYIALSPAVFGFGALSIASLLTLSIVSKSRVDALADPFGPPTWIGWTILLLFGSYALTHRAKAILSWIILLVASTVAIFSVMQHFQLLQTVFPAVKFLSLRSWTPLGTGTAIPWFALGCLPLLIREGSEAWKRRDGIIIFFVFLVASILVASVSFYAVLPPGEKIYLPFAEAWRITAQTFTVPLRAILGIGIENYLSAFTQARSATLNTTPIWNIRFGMSSSLLFHLATTMGIVGVAGLILLARSFLTQSKNVFSVVSAGVSILVLLLAPPSLAILALLVAVSLTSNKQDKIVIIHIPSHLSWLRVGAVVVAIVLCIAGIYAGGRAFISELTFMKSLQARQNGDGQASYNLQIQALNQNPGNTRFRVAFSQTNIDLADAIARSPQGQEVNEQDRQTITTLVQQAIREAKIAVNLSPQNTLAWENLALIYQELSKIAVDANQWAVASFQQVITLDPTNPLLRLSYGTLLIDLGQLDNAFVQFQSAAILKPDYAPAHYGLALIYRERQQYALEARALIETLKLVTTGSKDEEQARSELATAESRLTDEERSQIDGLSELTSEASRSSELFSPLQDGPTELIPKLNLPTEASPGALL